MKKILVLTCVLTMLLSVFAVFGGIGAYAAEPVKFTADFSQITDPATQLTKCRELFEFYYTKEKTFLKLNEHDPFAWSAETYDTEWRNVRGVLDGKWFKAEFDGNNNEAFRKGLTLAPKGNLGTVKNFETTFDVKLPQRDNSAFVVHFRSAVQGQVNFTNKRELYEYDCVIMNWNGYHVVSQGTAGGTGDEYTQPFTTAWKDQAQIEEAKVNLKVVGTTVELKVTSPDGSIVYCDRTGDKAVQLDDNRPAGYVYFSMMSGDAAIANVSITNIRIDGAVIDWSADGSTVPTTTTTTTTTTKKATTTTTAPKGGVKTTTTADDLDGTTLAGNKTQATGTTTKYVESASTGDAVNGMLWIFAIVAMSGALTVGALSFHKARQK